MVIYGYALCGMMILAFLSGRLEIILSALVVASSWFAWCMFIMATKIYEPWHFGIALDSAAAWFLLRTPSSRPKSILGAFFTLQIAMHVAYAAVLWWSGTADHEGYYRQLSLTSWGQLLIAGAWAGGSAARRVRFFRRVVSPLRHKAHNSNMGSRL